MSGDQPPHPTLFGPFPCKPSWLQNRSPSASVPDLDPTVHARLIDLLASGLDRYLRTKVDFDPDARVYAVMASESLEATRW
jgi:hypothetical protein